MKSKLIQIPYTVAIVKPHLVLKTESVSYLHYLFCLALTAIRRHWD